MIRFHHAHLMCSNIETTMDFFRRFFDATVAGDVVFAGTRNVLMRVGDGRIHLYEQPPRSAERNAVHHLGIQTDDLDALVTKMKAAGVKFRKDIAEDPTGRYIMVEAPDHVLLELFQIRPEVLSDELKDFFE